VPAEKGDVRNLTNTSGAAERDPSWSPDGKWIACFSDGSGEYRLQLRPQSGQGGVKSIALGGGVTAGNALAGVPPCRTVRAELPHTAPTSGAWRRNGRSDARAGPEPGETSDRRSARTVPTTDGASGYGAEARAANCEPFPVGTHSG